MTKQVMKTIDKIYPHKTFINLSNIFLYNDDQKKKFTLFINPATGNYMFASRNPGLMPRRKDREEKSKSMAALRLEQPVGENFTYRRQVLSSTRKNDDDFVDNEEEEECILPPNSRADMTTYTI